jgi:3-phenylpropionate/trans-cinnamate dioxygenase ferredoxin subunit
MPMGKLKVTWVKVAWPGQLTEASLPESKPVRVRGENGKYYCMVRSGGQLYVIDDKCPHAGGLLSNGWCDGLGNIVCPYHRFRYRLDTGQLAKGKGYYVNSYPLDERTDGLYIGIERRGWFF